MASSQEMRSSTNDYFPFQCVLDSSDDRINRSLSMEGANERNSSDHSAVAEHGDSGEANDYVQTVRHEPTLNEDLSDEDGVVKQTTASHHVRQIGSSGSQQPRVAIQRPLNSELSIIKQIIDIIRAPLHGLEEVDGIILMLRHPENDWVMIHMTTVDYEVALQNWRIRWGYEPRLINDPLMVQAVPMAYRTLKLICAELQNHRMVEFNCKGCQDPHSDWFSIDNETLLAVSSRWKIWMSLQPYGEKGELNEIWDSVFSDAFHLDSLKQFRQWWETAMVLDKRVKIVSRRKSLARYIAPKVKVDHSTKEAAIFHESDTLLLLYATGVGDEELLRSSFRLRSFKPNIESTDTNGMKPLHLAARDGCINIAEWLLNRGAKVDSQVLEYHITPLHVAAEEGHKAFVELLLRRGAGISIRNSTGKTALHKAAENNHQDIVGVLLAAGADVNCREMHGQTPLHIAAYYGHQVIVGALIVAGADVNSMDNSGKTPLHMAADGGHQATVEALLAAGAQVNLAEKNMITPLHIAADGGYEAIIDALIAAGAEVGSIDKYKRPALYYAALKGCRKVTQSLLRLSLESGTAVEKEVMMMVEKLMISSKHTQKESRSDFDLQSVATAGTFNDSGFFSGGQISQELVVVAKEQLFQLFATHEELQVLYKEAVEKISREKFIRNFKRLIRSFCLECLDSLEIKPQTNLKERDLVVFFGRQAIWFADRIYQEFKPTNESLQNAMNNLAKQRPDKIRQLDDFLGQHMVERQQVPEGTHHEEQDDLESNSTDSDAIFIDFSLDDAEFPNISQVRQFLLEGSPFQNLKENFRKFVYQDHLNKQTIIPEACGESGDTRGATSIASCLEIYLRYLLLWILDFIRTLLRPRIPKGYERITWTCGCGDSMYADVKELLPGAAQSLQETLRASAAGVVSQAASDQSKIKSPTPAHLPSENARQGSLNGPKTPIMPFDATLSNEPASDKGSCSNTAIATNDIVKRFLLLCVNTSKRVHLEQIDVSYTGDDQVLFQSIRQSYYNARKTQTRGYFLTPPRFLSSLLGEISFSRPKLANFVRFELVPIKTKTHAAVLDFPALPPVEEVHIKKAYHYAPCPKDIDNPLLQVQFLHEYFKPGRHLGRFWLNRVPKKLRAKLLCALDPVTSESESESGSESTTAPGGAAIGWGIHIIEEPNWGAYGLVAIVVLVASAVVAVGYSVLCRDVSGGFGVGAYAVTAQGVVLSALVLRWRES